ncbi:hypothetical protein [Streptomyces sp. NPDC050504]|uniref:hypothetical protein n=1 Tax=Streptomyces sp. NPDC050504 TaxID=3365618 RepID=UPI00378FA421
MRVTGGARVAGLVLAALLTAGCGGADGNDGNDGHDGQTVKPSASRGGQGSPSAPAPPASRGPLVEVTVTGGFAGIHRVLEVRGDGSYTERRSGEQDRTGRMSPAGLAELRTALAGADFARLPRRATHNPVRDGFSYEIEYGGRKVTTYDEVDSAALRAVIGALPRTGT